MVEGADCMEARTEQKRDERRAMVEDMWLLGILQHSTRFDTPPVISGLCPFFTK